MDFLLHDLHIAPEVAERLGHYVYLLIDPDTNRPFYVGKGQNGRALEHLSERAESRKCQYIAQLAAIGKEPRVDILAHGLRDAETAFRIEAAVIDLYGLDALTNQVRGWRSVQLGRLSLPELAAYYAAKPVKVEEPARGRGGASSRVAWPKRFAMSAEASRSSSSADFAVRSYT